MPNKFSAGTMEFAVSAKEFADSGADSSSSPLRLAILGDFTGRSSRQLATPLSKERASEVEYDNFDSLISELEVVLHLPATQSLAMAIDLRIQSLEDFHPDLLLERVEPLARLDRLRHRLRNPSEAATAIRELEKYFSAGCGTTCLPDESNDDALARLMGREKAQIPIQKAVVGGDAVSGVIKSILGSSVKGAQQPRHAAALTQIDDLQASILRGILHHPGFQALEAGWRTLDLLVRRIAPEENIQLTLIDISKDELAGDLSSSPDLPSTGFSKLLRDLSRDKPFDVLLGNYFFRPEVPDIAALAAVAKICGSSGTVFISGADSRFIGCNSFETQPDSDDWRSGLENASQNAWQALRHAPEASYVGLVLPRFLLRQPFGKKSDPIDKLAFEELPDGPTHESYLWGNSVFLCACIFIEAFQTRDRSLSRHFEIDGLALYSFRKDGEIQVQPPAEAWLTQRSVDSMLNKGFIPVVSIKGRDAVRLACFQSIALPPKPLSLNPNRWAKTTRTGSPKQEPPSKDKTADAAGWNLERDPDGLDNRPPGAQKGPWLREELPVPLPGAAAGGSGIDTGVWKRRLAAVMFTDAVNFSKRVASQEEFTLRLIDRDLQLMREISARYNGQVLKSTGDGLLIFFESAVKAVACALEIQNLLAQATSTRTQNESLLHRIGIHLGDVFLSNNDVMGDSVNIAARLQSEAQPGGICISQTVYDVVKNKLSFQVTSLGARELKNIRGMVPIYEILLAAQKETRSL